MNKIILTSLLIFYTFVSFAQEKQERIFYFVDSIPVLDTPDDSEQPANDDIANLEVITSPDKIKALGYEGKLDKIIFITTKAYNFRTAEVKRIPTTANMVKVDGIWHLKNSEAPYSGRFIDYFMNGRIEGDGILKEGVIDGVRTRYYVNGNKRGFYTYTMGIENGESQEYFSNGVLKQKGSFDNRQETGLWQVYYSTGKLKRQSNFVNHKQDLPKEEIKFYDLLEKAIAMMKEENYNGAIKKLDAAALLNPAYADVYFYRGTAKLDNFNFDEAVADFDKAAELEPMYMEAISNRAFARLRKYEFKASRTLTKNSEVTILAAKDHVDIPKEDQDKICADLKLGYELGDHKPMIVDAMKRYCK